MSRLTDSRSERARPWRLERTLQARWRTFAVGSPCTRLSAGLYDMQRARLEARVAASEDECALWQAHALRLGTAAAARTGDRASSRLRVGAIVLPLTPSSSTRRGVATPSMLLLLCLQLMPPPLQRCTAPLLRFALRCCGCLL